MNVKLVLVFILSFFASVAESRECSSFWRGYHGNTVYPEDVREIDAALPCSNVISSFPGTPEQALSFVNIRNTLDTGMYNVLARRNSMEMSCRVGYYDRMLAGDRDQLLGAAIDRFVQLRREFAGTRSRMRREGDATLEGMRRNSSPEDNKFNFGTAMVIDNGIERARQNILSGVPFGIEPDVQRALLELDETLPPDFYNDPVQVARFETAYRNAIQATRTRYYNGDKYLRDQFQTMYVRNPSTGAQVPSGGYYRMNDDTWRAFANAGSFEDLAQSLQSGQPPVSAQAAHRMVCTLDMLHGGGADTSETTTTTAIGVAGLATGPAAPFVEAGIALYYTGQAIRQCFFVPDIDVVQGQSCVQTGTLDTAIQNANGSRCAQAAVPALLGVGGAAATFRATWRIVRNADGAVVGLRPAGSALDGALARGVDEAVESEVINVTATLSARQWRERGTEVARQLGRRGNRAAILEEAGFTARAGAPNGFQKYCSRGDFCLTLPNGNEPLSRSAQRDLADAYARRADGNAEWIHPEARVVASREAPAAPSPRTPALGSRGGARGNPVSIARALDASESAWAKTQRYMRQNGIADTPENRERILEVFDGFLSREMSPLGTRARQIRDSNSLRIVDAPQAEQLANRGVPRYVIDHVTIDHHNGFGAALRPGQENSTTQILDLLDPATPGAPTREAFNARFRNVASDNVGDAFGLARATVRNADRLRADPALRARIREVALAEDFKVFGPQLDLAADDTVAATLRLNDTLIPKTERTFADRVSESFGPRTRRAIEDAGPDYDRVLFPKTQADRDYVRQLASEFRTGVDDGIRRAETARIPVNTPDGESAPIYLGDTTALNAQANGTFEGFVTIPQYVRRIEANGAPPIERNFTFSGSDSAPTRSMFFANMPGRGTSMLTAPNGGRSFADVFVEAEKNAIVKRLAEGRLPAEAQTAARQRLDQIQAGTFRPQSRPDGSLLFGPTYMSSSELRAFVQSEDALRALGYGQRAAPRAESAVTAVPLRSGATGMRTGEVATSTRNVPASGGGVAPSAPGPRRVSPASRSESARASSGGRSSASSSASVRMTAARKTELEGKYRLEISTSGENPDELLPLIDDLERIGTGEAEIRAALIQCRPGGG